MVRKSWGGRRKGAGRPTVPEEEKHQPTMISLPPHQKAWLEAEKERTGQAMSRIIQELIDEAMAQAASEKENEEN